jgi:hypothetical protein
VSTFPQRAAHGSPAPATGRRAGGLGAARAAIAVLALLPASGRLEGATLRVPEDHPTARAAVAAAAAGDTILLAPGVHAGGVYVDGRPLTFASRWLATGDTSLVARTVLSGAAADMCAGRKGCVGRSVLEFGPRAHGSAVIGLTVTGGEDGIRSQAVVDIVRCRVIGNGDGVDFVSGSGGTFRQSLFAHNRDDGIDLNGRVQATITDNDILENGQDGVEYRLHAYRGPRQRVEFIGNRIARNRSDGIQLIDYPDVSDREIRIERNLFTANGDAAVGFLPDGRTIEDFGGAPLAERVTLIHNTFLDERHGLIGGANVVVLNNLFARIRGGAVRRVGGRSVVAHNLLWEAGAACEECAVTPSAWLEADPRLDGRGRPGAGSPAVDAGVAAFAAAGEALLSTPGSAFAGSAPDLGAFEAVGPGGPTRGPGSRD